MNKQRSFGVVLQYVQMAISILISLLYTPIMLRILGKNEYGIYSLAASIIAYLSLLSLGFGSSYLRYYYRYKKDEDEESIKRMNGLYLGVFSLMGVLSLVAGLILAQNASIFFNETYSKDEIETSKVLMSFLAVNLAISFPASVFTSYVTSQEKFIFQKILNLGKTIVSPLVNIVILYLGFGSIGMVVSTTIFSIIIDAINIFYCLSKLKMKISFRNPNFWLLKEIFLFSIFVAINQVIDQVNWQTDKLVLGKMINGGAIAVYAVGSQINTMYVQLSTAISSVFSPKVNRIVMQNSNNMDEELTSLFIKVGRIQWFVLSLVFMGFIFFGKFFISKWAGNDYGNSYYVALLLMAPELLILCQNIGIEIQRAKNKHQFRSIVYLQMAFVNVAITIYFVSLWGEVGAALGTTISIVIANVFIMNFYYQNKLGINVVRFWKSIAKASVSFFPCVVFGLIIVKLYSFKGLVDYIMLILSFSLLYCTSIYLWGFNPEEKRIVKSIVTRVLQRRKAR